MANCFLWHVLIAFSEKSGCTAPCSLLAFSERKSCSICVLFAPTRILVVASRLCLAIPICMVMQLQMRHIDAVVYGIAVIILLCCPAAAFGAWRPIFVVGIVAQDYLYY